MIVKRVFADEIVDNHLNLIHLAIAITEFHIQSETLYISYQIDFFLSDLSCLQMHETAFFIVLMFEFCFKIISDNFIIFVIRLCRLSNALKRDAVML